MQEFLGGELYGLLSMPIHGAGVRSASYERRLHNIEWVRNLDREGLAYEENERQILIHETSAGERLYIQYPGSESIREGQYYRPWDFRPVLYRNNGTRLSDLTFQNIWDILNDVLNPLSEQEPEVLRLMARLFYGIAHVYDYELLGLNEVRHLAYEGPEYRVVNTSIEDFEHLYVFQPNQDALGLISNLFDNIDSISLEALLGYNDLLAWNEDCKYYYGDVVLRGLTWHEAKGRVNNILTHISVIGLFLGDVQLSNYSMRFARSGGVSPATQNEIRAICGCLVH